MPQFSRAIRSLLSGAVMLLQRDAVEAPADAVAFALRCSKSLRCLCIVDADSPGGVPFGCMGRRTPAMWGVQVSHGLVQRL